MRSLPAAFCRPFSEGRRDVEPGERLACARDIGFAAQHGGDQLFEMRGFRDQRMRPRLRHAPGFLMQIDRIEAHDASERLAVGETAGRHH